MNPYRILKTALLVGISLLVLYLISPIQTSQATYSPGVVLQAQQWNNQPGLLTPRDVEAPTCHPAIDIRKQEEGPDTRFYSRDSDIDYEIVVTNTGDVELSNVVVADADVPDCSRDIGTLAVGEEYPYSCGKPDVTEGFTNIAKVTGGYKDQTVSDEDPSTVKIAEIDIRKQEEGPDTRFFAKDSDVDYEIVVTNTGEVELSDVIVTDDQVTDCSRSIGTLAAGQQAEPYFCVIPGLTEGFTNIAKVTGEYKEGEWVSDEDPSTVELVDETRFNITVGFEDLKLVKSSDFDYNDWAISILTKLQGVYVDEDAILLEKITFDMTPVARGALLGHEFHLRVLTDTFESSGDAELVIQDSSGNPLKTEQYDFISSAGQDFLINFDITEDPDTCDCEAFVDHPENGIHDMIRTVEANQDFNQPARRKAELSIAFHDPFVFNLRSYGQHCEDLFFDPYLYVKATDPYKVSWIRPDQQSETRIICVQDPLWEWPEESRRIDFAYTKVEWLDEPTFFFFPPNWDDSHNTCVFDNQPCFIPVLYLPVLTK